MTYLETMQSAFMDELEKIGEVKEAISHRRVIEAVEKTTDPKRLLDAFKKGRRIERRMRNAPGALLTPAGDQAESLSWAAHMKLQGRHDDLADLKAVRTSFEGKK
jgi:hypothetical protein